MNATPSNEAFWETHYARGSSSPAGTPPRPNDAFVNLRDAFDTRVGRALDLGTGSGGDAIWLAERGWHVTAVDISATAVARLRDLAEKLRLSDNLRAVQHDLERSMPTVSFDLVYACYMHTFADIGRPSILRRAADLARVGGILIVIDHASTAPWSWAHPDTR